MTEWDFEREHLRRIKGYQREVRDLFDDTIEQVFFYLSLYPLPPTSVSFRLYKYPVLKAQIEERLETFRVRLQSQIEGNIRSEFAASDIKARVLLPSNPADTFSAQEQFVKRRRYGRTLSDRVWNIHNALQVEIEKTLSERVPQSMSATGMAKSLKKQFNSPVASSYKSALRLAFNETHSAYRKADISRWQETPFVLGYEIRLNPAHPTNNEVIKCHLLEGVYPTTFQWEMWHPFCICQIRPLLPTEEELAAYNQAVVNGEGDNFKFKGKILTPHSGFTSYVSDNLEVLEGRKRLPYWITENKQYLPE